MEPKNLHGKRSEQVRSTVDTSRAFGSVREAVAIFDERLLLGEFHSPHRSFARSPIRRATPLRSSVAGQVKDSCGDDRESNGSGNPEQEEKERELHESIRKLEAELQETKEELNWLKKRESDTEVALATLNADLHKNMSRLAEAEAAAAAGRAASFERVDREAPASKEKDGLLSVEDGQTLSQILSMGEGERAWLAGKRERKKMKKKPIIPLVGDLFWRKKVSATDPPTSLYSSPFFL